MSENKYTATLNDYLPAVLKENASGWLIEYYVLHPVEKRLVRKQMRVQSIVKRYKTKKDARRHLSKIIFNLNQKLETGWNPFFEHTDSRMFEKLSVVLDAFLSEKRKELREHTMRSYESFARMLAGFLPDDPMFSMIGQGQAVRYMDYLYTVRDVAASTYNNHLKMGRALFNWALEKQYTKQNPFSLVKPKPRQKKSRTIIPAPVRAQIADYLIAQNNTPFLLICKLVFFSLIRPKEILLIQLKHIHLEDNYIRIPGKNAKNRSERLAAISPDIKEDLKKLNINDYPAKYFLFSSDLKPGKDPAHYRRAGKEWDKLRKALSLPAEMQLYSLRDSGIFEMLKSGIDDLSVMQHADHSSLEITTKYANHADINLISKISSMAPKF